MKNFWSNKKVLVTGGTGFIGSYVSELLVKKGARVTVTTRNEQISNITHIQKYITIQKADLNQFDHAHKVTKGQDVVINLVAKVAGIQFNREHPAMMFSENVRLVENVIEAARLNRVERFLIVSSGCVYAREAAIPITEATGFTGDPEPTNLGYGWGKRVGELFGRLYAAEYGMKVAIVRPFNTYGPRDDFDPATSHVIPGLIRRIYANENPLVVWGSGKQTRSFIYAQDFARGLLELTEKYAVADPVNLSSNEEITIKELANLIIRLTQKNTKILFDASKPDGQPRRQVDTSKATDKIGFKTSISLEEGIQKTIEWYTHH